MQRTLLLQEKTSPPFFLFAILILALLVFLYLQFRSVQSVTNPLVDQLQKTIEIDASKALFEEAIRATALKMAEELGIDLGNYDISLEEYEELAAAAAEKFGICEQYRIYSITGGLYNCYPCVSKSKILLLPGQTYKYGQTCLGEKGRYIKGMPEPNLFYLTEFKGSIFEVLVVEHIKLQLFRFSKERELMIQQNSLLKTELLLPPANKILR